MCCACSKFVCEGCNDIQVRKLKSIVKVCKTLRFFCKTCISNDNEELEHEATTAIELDNDDAKYLRDELKDKENIISSMEKANSAFSKLVDERNELIENQKTIIKNLKDDIDLKSTKEDLKEVRKIIALKEKELELEDYQRNTPKPEDQNDDKSLLLAKRKETENTCDALAKKLEDQCIITQKNELAYNTQELSIASKNENIESLKTIISQHRSSCSCQNTSEVETLTSYVPQQDENKEEDGALRHLFECKKTGFQESIICLSQIALHGLIVNGLLLWADIQRRTTPSKEWKEKALIHFNDEEISNAKNLLWDVSNEEIIGKKVNRQGPSKQESEINVIELALNALAEEEKIALFVASSSTVMQTPGQDHTQPELKGRSRQQKDGRGN